MVLLAMRLVGRLSGTHSCATGSASRYDLLTIDMILRSTVSALVVGLCLLPPLGSSAQTLLDTIGFESPLYVAGNLIGQDGWLDLGDGAATAEVQSAVALDGTNSLKVQRTPGSLGFWAQFVSDSSAENSVVSIEWDMRVEGTNSPSGFGPFMGISVFDDSSGSILQLSALGFDATTGDVLVQAAGTGELTETGLQLGFGQWAHYRMVLNFADDQYQAYVNGAFLTSQAFVDGPSDELTDIDITALAGGEDATSMQLAGTAYIDNLIAVALPPGDFNWDSQVDGADFLAWQRDTRVGSLADWQANYGQPMAASAEMIPEPSSLSLVLILVSLTVSRRRR